MRRIAAISTAVALGLLAMGSGPPQIVSTAHADAEPLAAADAAAKGTLVVKGVAKRKTGSVIANSRISVHKLTADPHPALIAGGRTNSHGHFSLKIRRTSSLANYAANHNGRLNLVLWVYKGKRVYLRAVQVPYHGRKGKAAVPARDTYPLGDTRLLASVPLGTKPISLAAKDGEVLGRHWTKIASISASRGFTTELKYYKNLETSVSFGIVTSGGNVTGSGSISLGSSSGTSLEPTLTGRKVRRDIEVEIEHRTKTICDYRSWLNGGRQCTDYVWPEWRGAFRDIAARARSCDSLPDDNHQWISVNRNIAWSATKTKGKNVTSTWGLGGYGFSVAASTSFSETNLQRWSVPDGRHTVVTSFCLGGIDGSWNNEASEVITDSHWPEKYPCHPRPIAYASRRC